MRLNQFKEYFKEQLSSIYPQTEIDTFFFYLIEEYLGLQRIDFTLQPNFEITSEKEELLNNALDRLKKEEPIQYIIGHTEFYGLPFKVNQNTLIPRPETEELVEWILFETKDRRQEIEDEFNILDIGTGTGCIPISLKQHLPNDNVSAIDVSDEALKVAKQNAELNKTNINFIFKDILKADNLNVIANKMKQSHINEEITSSNIPRNDEKYDVIVSNPPYVRNLEKAEIKNNVLKNEPHLALFVEDDNPLIFYIKIADLAKKHLSKNGLLFFEINQYLGAETVTMLQEKGFTNIELRKDLFGNDRMIKASL
ncbi:glutamine methyltransferase [Tenacibaculum holothuriorum]|uniref:Release factor glutamine methyltransferase n=1 Tax=Tenacibaculum holothuriorum TaxID=1635173 RepID=A0A1Y2PGH0_9FLAO|nr:peptide chain release factor N(5)-glutamine methyltransferase [Tenacibaculum holothuriorum]OSY89574.1 glutamine methyltransferase [Tenacibaculum holothuriorum]